MRFTYCRECKDPIIYLTTRENVILRLLAQGLPNKEIAQRLQLSEKTIKNKVSDFINFFGVSSRTQLAVIAIQNGLIVVDWKVRLSPCEESLHVVRETPPVFELIDERQVVHL